MAGKLIKKGKAAPAQTRKPAPAAKSTIQPATSLRAVVAAKVASRPTEQTDARSAWRKLFGG